MRRVVLDAEADGLLETVTKIHCVCYYDIDTKESGSLTNYSEITQFLFTCSVIIGHNIVKYDIPLIKKILSIDLRQTSIKFVDSMGISQYLYPKREKHGLEEWGKLLGIPKPKVEDWQNASIETYIHRCTEDVKINTKLWEFEIDYLMRLYDHNKEAVNRILGYIDFKLDCIREQEEVKWKVDVPKIITNLETLEIEKQPKIDALISAMPLHKIYKIKEKPKKPYKQDGTPSEHGKKWFDLLKSLELPEYHNGALKILDKVENGNPLSPTQMKDWLYSLGWIPVTFKYVRNKKLADPYSEPPRKVPQIVLTDGSGDLCPSVIRLFEIEPALEHYQGLTMLNHRIGILNGLLEEKDSNDMVKAEASAFTNTMRFTHKKPLTNLPTVYKPYGKEVREVLIAPDEDHVLCGSDMSGLEDQCKRHYIYPYDPEYVKEQMHPDWDSHIDIGKQGNLISIEEEVFYRWYNKTREENKDYPFTVEENAKMNGISKRRKDSKQANFSCTYGAGPAKIALTSLMTIQLATLLHKVYWERNWAIKKIAEACVVKIIDGQMWLFNPVSQFWYSLRALKDRFSTLNQGTGAYAFDTWVRRLRLQGIKMCGQFHDEKISAVLKGQEEDHREKHLIAIRETNEILQLNVELGISIAFGNNYAEIH